MKENKINFTLRIEPSLKFQLERIAHNEDRTLTNLINMALKRYVDVYNGVKKQGREINLYPKIIYAVLRQAEI